ncbi:DNRLRE domain-containing protein, partial [Cohnella rhizoplanae]|uniref:DNRLRE domain-containing protein n=1 Tax=Cohnella rhizoplanae TaxID=2974897 RepID=UPI003D7C2A87
MYDGTGWTAADNGLSGNESNGKGGPLAVSGDTLYLVWSSSISGIRASQYRAETAPATPTGLKAEPGDGEVSLSWDAGSGTASYEIYKGTSSGSYDPTPVDTVSGSTGRYTVTGLANGTTYYFTVRAVNGGGSSDYAQEAFATAGVLHVGASAGCDYRWTTDAEQAAQICNSNPLQAGTFVDYDADLEVYKHRITRQSVLKFNLPAAGAPIASARLKFFVTQPLVSPGAPDASVIIHTGDSAWEPQAVNNGSIVPAPMPVNTSATPKYTIGADPRWYTIDVTSTVWDQLDNGKESMVFIMKGTDTADDTLMSGFSYLSSGFAPELELTFGTRSPAPALTGLTWAPGGTPGTTKLTGADGDPLLRYLVGPAGRYSQPTLGADAAELGYAQTLNPNEDIPVTIGQHIYVLQTDDSGKTVKWADVAVEDKNIAVSPDPQPEPAPEIVGFTWDKGSEPGTTKVTHLPSDATYKYAVGAAGTKTQPNVGDDAAAAGYTNSLLYNADIAVESGDHIYVTLVDSAGKIVKWADVAVEDKNIAVSPEPQPEPAPEIVGFTWDKGSEPGTTKVTHLPADATYKYAVGAAGTKTQPNVGDDAAAAGYTNSLLYNAD